MSFSNSHKYVFINGIHRTGTTVLARLLAANEGVCGFEKTGVPMDEGQFLQTVFESDKPFGGPGTFALNKNSWLDESSPLATNENAEKLIEEWSRYWDLSKKLLLEKSPPNIVRTRFLQKIFPNSYFITIYRNPVATCYATEIWCKAGLRKMLRNWLASYNKYKADEPFLKRRMSFKYEDLIKDPQNTVAAISTFLEHPIVIPHNFVLRTNTNDKYIERWVKYKKTLEYRFFDKKEIEQLEPEFNKFGYSLLK